MVQLFPQNPGQAPRPPQPGQQAAPQQRGAAQQGPQMPQFSAPQQQPQVESNLLEYLQNNQGRHEQTAELLTGERPEPNYAPSMLQVGSSLLQGSGDVTRSLGRGIEQAIPLMQQAQQPARQYDQAQQEMASQMAMQEYQSQQEAIQAREAAQQELETWRYKTEYEAFVEQMGQGPEIKEVGNVAVDETAFRQKVQAGKDRQQAFEESIIYDKPTAPEQRWERYDSMMQHAQSLRLQGKYEAAESAERQAESFKEFVGANDERTTQAWARDPKSDKMIPFVGSPEEVQRNIDRLYDEERGRKMKNMEESAADSLAIQGRLLELSKNSDVISQGKAGEYASMMSAWAKAGREMMGGEARSQFQSRIGDDPRQFIQQLQNSKDPAVKENANPALLDYLEGLGEESARIQTNVVELAYSMAVASKDGAGRVTNADIARNLRQIAYNEEAMVNDPAALQAGLMEKAKSTLDQHLRGMRYEDTRFETQQGLKAIEFPKTGFVLEDINDPYSMKHVGKEEAQQWWDSLTAGERRQAEETQQEGAEQQQQGGQQAPPSAQRQTPEPPQDTSGLPSVQAEEDVQALEPGSWFILPDGELGYKGAE